MTPRLLAAVLLVAAEAAADPAPPSLQARCAPAGRRACDPRLVLTHEPPPRHLRMRPRVAQRPDAEEAAPKPQRALPAAPTAKATSFTRSPDDERGAALRDLENRVSFSIDLGYQVEAASPSGRASLGGSAPRPGEDYTTLRSYGFGELFGSTRGLGLSSLSTYFAVRFQAAREQSVVLPDMREVPIAPPIATWFTRSGFEARTGWAEMRDFLPASWGLSKLRVRAGSQHVYGPWITHLDGVLLSYDGPILTASGYSGYRHSDYTREQPDRRPQVTGASLRVDLRGLPTPLPLAVQAEYLRLGASEASMQPGSTSGLLQGDWRPGRDIALIGQFRFLDGDVASQRLEVRARYRQVTNLVVDLVHRTEDDWRWDPSLTAPDQEPLTARRYLDLGPVVPQLLGSIRAGTLIAENVDLFVRGAFSADTRSPGDPASAWAAPYLELGGALEVRVRRQLAFGASLLTRSTSRELLAQPIEDARDATQPLPPTESIGEEGFTELGASLRMTLGARRFSSLVELYGRNTRFAPLYEDPLTEVPTDDLRFGGRVTLDAWVGDNVRLFAAYDVSSSLDLAPEITGYRSLRLMMTGVY